METTSSTSIISPRMSLQWTFIATVLYTEIVCVLLLLLPFISPARWQTVFRSRLIAAFRSHASLYFNVFVGVLCILFFDAVRDVKKYSAPLDETDLKNNPTAETLVHMKLFRAQRNLYIAGFALFLFVVLRRLITLIATQARLSAESEASQRQAESATNAAKMFMEDKENKTNEDSKELVDQLEKKRSQAAKLTEELSKAEANAIAMKKQAEATNVEYDRLLKEHAQLQDKVKRLEGDSGTKKDD